LLPGSLGNRRTVPEGFAVSDDTEIDAKIKSGEIEAPIALSESGRAKGWTGQQIINHQQRLFSRKS
jgi:hypothetical protein